MKKYPAKTLLFGEHTVNLGSQALAMPLPMFSGQWAFAQARNKWTDKMEAFAEYLATAPLQIPLDTARFKQELSEGLYFSSNIPTGYGAGSSGALVAAIFDRYCLVREGKDLAMLKKTFAGMEGFFHGTSSGTDPLISYLGTPVLLNGRDIKKVVLPDMPPPFSFFLLDTGMERQAAPFITHFLEKSKEPGFAEILNTTYLPIVDDLIKTCLTGDWVSLFGGFELLSRFQFLNMAYLIPTSFQDLWKAGLAGDFFKLKICGAGGGGFLLGMTNDFARVKSEYPGVAFFPV